MNTRSRQEGSPAGRREDARILHKLPEGSLRNTRSRQEEGYRAGRLEDVRLLLLAAGRSLTKPADGHHNVDADPRVGLVRPDSRLSAQWQPR